MKVLFDIAHPAHVHFYRHLVTELRARGNEVAIMARHKDVTTELLTRLDLTHEAVGVPGDGRFGQIKELVMRDWVLTRRIRQLRPDVVLTRNPSGVQAAFMARVPGVFDTDDGRAAGVHFRAAKPFARVITTPDCIGEDYGRKHVTYPSYKVLAYLHPDRFQPDPGVLHDLGIVPGEPYALVRFVAMSASHDQRESGLPIAVKREVVDRLRRRGRVFLTSEAPLPPELERHQFPLEPDRLHDALAFASWLVGDSQTMAAEAAVLGVPNLRCSSFAGRLTYLEELEHRYALTRGFTPERAGEFLAALDEMLSDADAREEWGVRRSRMLSDKCDLTAWHLDFIDDLVGGQ